MPPTRRMHHEPDFRSKTFVTRALSFIISYSKSHGRWRVCTTKWHQFDMSDLSQSSLQPLQACSSSWQDRRKGDPGIIDEHLSNRKPKVIHVAMLFSSLDNYSIHL